jgi:hypothetical protein
MRSLQFQSRASNDNVKVTAVGVMATFGGYFLGDRPSAASSTTARRQD